ncbi:MAG: hypothetical protein K8S27_10990 [Candidatus Omnitrophica bacterium]|nr:hypothetical protein [Candidatus Omnitrophota bacterium]
MKKIGVCPFVLLIITISLHLCSQGFAAETKSEEKKKDQKVSKKKSSEDDVDIIELLEILEHLDLLDDFDSLMEETHEK